MKTILQLLLFGCSHRRITFPQKPPKRPAYVACLDCGKEFDYDWKAMRVGKESAA